MSELLPSSPLQKDWLELPRQLYVAISSAEDVQKKTSDLDLFKTGDAQRKVLGHIPTNVQKLSGGALLVNGATESEVTRLLNTMTFGGVPCTSARYQKLNCSKGVVCSHELKDCCRIEEIVANCEGVTHARGITLRRGKITLEINTIILTFDSCRSPATVRPSYLVFGVRPYVPNPLRCFKCQKFGHSQSRCRNAASLWQDRSS
ncbi:uncharacterized protein LOC106012710 [Aplysia californica]|uniref:Uncharacterized protein LOC106012710 n=1 Tax=Aplysia californica TaxID=6500 RepID=A0ABM1A6Q9_APLCA|nr:uncharacterized protein LOC106012710 [Aplysia californica]